jgi:hypothetical protein
MLTLGYRIHCKKRTRQLPFWFLSGSSPGAMPPGVGKCVSVGKRPSAVLLGVVEDREDLDELVRTIIEESQDCASDTLSHALEESGFRCSPL